MYVDDEGLEEQFLTEDEASQEVMNITANRVTTPVETEDDAAPLNPIYTQRSQQDEDLDLQLLRGPRDKNLGEAIGNFLDDNYEDILCTSNIQTNFCISDCNLNIPGRPALSLGWIVSDGTNQTLEEIREKKVANGTSPGGGNTGAIITSLQNLEPYYGTQFLGGLSLHLTHLIASHMTNYDWPFGTLPFGLFGSNLDTRDLETYPRTYSGHF